MSEEFYVSSDKELLDQEFIIREIQASYWGGDQSKATILKAIDHSICFGLYRRKEGKELRDVQVGFARIITDYATVAWLCDVLIMNCYQKMGLGRMLVQTVLKHPEVQPRNVMLFTATAQRFYEKLGFKRFEGMKMATEGR